MFLNDRKLREWASAGGVTPFDPDCINPASIDLRWSGRYKAAGVGGWGSIQTEDRFIMLPGTLFLLDTIETVTIPEYVVGWLALKSSMGRKGLEHLHAGFFDPGFSGTATLEMENRAPWPIELVRGQRIIQLALADCEIPLRTYQVTGRYNGQAEPTEAR
jgi:deoxycytidine triphosphate deaminase